MTRVNLTLTGSDDARRIIVNAPPDVRRVIIKAVAQLVRQRAQERIRTQTDVDGNAFAPRKHGRKKLLIKMGQLLTSREISETEYAVGYDGKRMGELAYKHQQGFTETVVPQQSRNNAHFHPDYSAPATRRMASELLNVGYKIRRKGDKGWKTPTVNWIVQHLKIGQAGAILRELRGQAHSQYQIVVPARSFLGLDRSEQQHILDDALALPDVKQVLDRYGLGIV